MVVHPPSPRSVHAKLKSVSLSPPRALRRLSQPLLQSAITNFILTPHSQPHVPEPTQAVSIFTRLMAVIKNHAPSHSYSFTLSPVPGALTPAKGFVPIAPAPAGQEGTDPLTPMPLLTFHDRTPVFTAYRRSGLLEMDEQQCRNLGVEPSFYIAAALTYLEFLEDREVSSFVHLLACCFDQRTLLSASEHPCAELPGGSLRLMPARGSPRAGRGLRLRAPGIRLCYVFNLFYVSDPEGIVPYRIASMIFPLSQIARAYALSALLSPSSVGMVKTCPTERSSRPPWQVEVVLRAGYTGASPPFRLQTSEGPGPRSLENICCCMKLLYEREDDLSRYMGRSGASREVCCGLNLRSALMCGRVARLMTVSGRDDPR